MSAYIYRGSLSNNHELASQTHRQTPTFRLLPGLQSSSGQTSIEGTGKNRGK